jgi:hypothetical protein
MRRYALSAGRADGRMMKHFVGARLKSWFSTQVVVFQLLILSAYLTFPPPLKWLIMLRPCCKKLPLFSTPLPMSRRLRAAHTQHDRPDCPTLTSACDSPFLRHAQRKSMSPLLRGRIGDVD